MAEARRFLKFCMVGAVGFVFDAGLTVVITELSTLSPMVARIPAFFVASLVTFALNRRLTFGHSGGFWRAWMAYLAASIVGALLNYAVYVAVLAALGQEAPIIVLGIGLGAVLGLIFNYWMSSRVIFRPHDQSDRAR